jgi:muramoyltetrapeptide carboxypeptidase
MDTRRTHQLKRIYLLVTTALCVGGLFVASGCTTVETPEPIRPRALQPGDTIAIVAPAGYLDEPRVLLAKQRLEEHGYHVVFETDVFRQRGYLAGRDERRAGELMAAFLNPEIDAIFPGTGNYGSTRILNDLDYDVIRANPKIFIGFSDITGLHLAIYEKANLVTFHSPNPMWGLGSEAGLHPLAERYFWRALRQDGQSDANGAGYVIEVDAERDAIRTITPGRAQGRLIGGNLTLINTLMGTPFEIDTQGKILFIEDIGERPYRIDRYLSQLRLAGKLQPLAGVVIGRFRDCEEDPDKPSLTLPEIFDEYFADLGIPVIADYPVGHVRQNVTLPIGALAELDADAQTLRILESPTRP